MASKSPSFYKDLMKGPIPDASITGGQIAYLRSHPEEYAEVLDGMEATLTAARVKNYATRLFREGGAPITKAHAKELVQILTTGLEVA